PGGGRRRRGLARAAPALRGDAPRAEERAGPDGSLGPRAHGTERGSSRVKPVRDILVVGSVALDSVRTPFGEVVEGLGGSASYFSISASHFAPVRVVAVVGSDFSDDHRRMLERHGVDLSGLEVADGRTFRWRGEYTAELG